MVQENFIFQDHHPHVENIRESVLKSLSQNPPWIASKYLYDERGSELFDEICQQPEYYQTRTEIALLETHAKTIADMLGAHSVLMELGSGHSRKIRILLNELGPGCTYVPIDISKNFLREHALKVAKAYPNLSVVAVCADMLKLNELEGFKFPPGKRALFFPGSTIGNFEPATMASLFKSIGTLVGEGGVAIIGVDLKKDIKTLNAAYNDANGITAEFELNVLRRINGEIGANFDIQKFEYEGFYNEQNSRVEMYLESQATQTVDISGKDFTFEKGQSIHIENSYKFTIAEFQGLARKAGFEPKFAWTDENEMFCLHYLERPSLS